MTTNKNREVRKTTARGETEIHILTPADLRKVNGGTMGRLADLIVHIFSGTP